MVFIQLRAGSSFKRQGCLGAGNARRKEDEHSTHNWAPAVLFFTTLSSTPFA